MSYDEAKKTLGKFYDSFSLVIDHDADVYRIDDKGNTVPLFFFRKAIIPDHYMRTALTSLKSTTKKASSMRITAGGGDNNGRVKSIIVGYFDKPIIQEKSNIIKNKLIPCRTTAFTKNQVEKWHTLMPLINEVDALYNKFLPKNHAEQLSVASLTPEYQIENTAFSTITVNYNWRTACHVDSGDYHNGFSVILVATEGDFTGGHLGYPRYNVCVDLKHGDFILKDPHQFHANTPIIPKDPNKEYTRLSMVFYYREGIQKCVGYK